MKTVNREELNELLGSQRRVALIEVLEPDAYRKYHLPGAINVPLGEEFEQRVQETVPDKNMPIVVYCMNTECHASPNAAEKLDTLGYADVYDYAGGKEDWKAAGLPVEE